MQDFGISPWLAYRHSTGLSVTQALKIRGQHGNMYRKKNGLRILVYEDVYLTIVDPVPCLTNPILQSN